MHSLALRTREAGGAERSLTLPPPWRQPRRETEEEQDSGPTRKHALKHAAAPRSVCVLVFRSVVCSHDGCPSCGQVTSLTSSQHGLCYACS